VDYTNISRLDGKVALVTGGARGLGAEIAEALLQMGASVMITDVLDQAGADTTAALQLKAPGRVAFLHHDVTCEADWEAAVAGTLERFARLDVLVNNAGIETQALFADCELGEFQRTMAINVDGVFLGIKHAIRAMRPGGPAGKGGAIVNLSSVAGLVGMPTLGAYCASKAAVRMMSKAAAVECGRLAYGIRVNSLHPGVVKTDMGINVVKNFARLGMVADEASADAMVESMHPIGYGQPGDVASAVLYLASDAARWTTGAELVIDGGATAA
jgi:NAD(P)-dependent dehydrogenase (short-subunit alcohol dehydrogenase family)